jgi:hypothetical protein
LGNVGILRSFSNCYRLVAAAYIWQFADQAQSAAEERMRPVKKNDSLHNLRKFSAQFRAFSNRDRLSAFWLTIGNRRRSTAFGSRRATLL